MRVCILMGSPRKNGNTNALRLPFQDELEQLDHTVTTHCCTTWISAPAPPAAPASGTGAG